VTRPPRNTTDRAAAALVGGSSLNQSIPSDLWPPEVFTAVVSALADVLVADFLERHETCPRFSRPFQVGA
jgi:hypothetical protein